MSELARYRNVSLSGGVNTRISGRLLADDEAISIINLDISVPGLRVKRLEPKLAVTLEVDEASGGGGGSGGDDGEGGVNTGEGDSSCQFSISPPTVDVGPCAVSGSATLTVLSSSGTCWWEAISNDDWITITSGATGTGNGTVGYDVAANDTGEARQGSFRVASLTIIVNQEGKTVTNIPQSDSFSESGGTDTVNVDANGACVAWTAADDVSWIAITSGSSGTGDGAVGYTVDPNDTTVARTGHITVTATNGNSDVTTIHQDGAAFNCAATQYRILGYSSTFFGVPSCGADSGLPAWDGTFAIALGSCRFRPDATSLTNSVRGKQLAGGLSILDGTAGTIEILAEPGTGNIIWAGSNSVANPLKFTRTGGCSATPAFLRVEEY